MNYWVVVVDDEVLSLTNARTLLNEKGMKVSALRSGKELLKFMEKNTPDLVLLDVLMPEMDGFETFHALRELEDKQGKSHVPVIFLTGENGSETERRGLKAGASDFIRKPFNKDILIRRIDNTIKNSKTIETLTEEATVDKLTGFLNKSSGTTRISEIVKTAVGAMVILDLDNFKLVNDLHGHDMGDRVLEAFADIVRHNTRAEDIVSRIGGDEFLAFFRDVTEEQALEALTKRLNEQLFAESVKLMGEDFDIPIGISVGGVFTPKHGTDYEKLFQFADSALYHVKQNGKHGVEIYDFSMEEDEDDEDLGREIGRVTRLVEERNDGRGAMLLGQDAFSNSYRFIIRFIKRYKGRANKLLFAISSKEGNEVELNEAVNRFGDVLKNCLRKNDIIMRNRPNQFFLLLPELSEEDVPKVVGRIMNGWNRTDFSESTEVKYASELVSYRD